MAEMDADFAGMEEHFAKMVATLRDARLAVNAELESLAQAPYLDRRALVVLDESVRDFANQTDALIVMMADRGAPDELAQAARQLEGFFHSTRRHIASLLAVGRG